MNTFLGASISHRGLHRSLTRIRLLVALVLGMPGLSALADSYVVFNELHYHPASNEASQEWVELYNQNSVDVDLSGWRLAGGVDFIFPGGTTLKAGGYLVVAASPSNLAVLGIPGVLGPFDGRLSNQGERLELRDNAGRLMDVLRYGIDGDWPVAPDGAGPTLAKRGPNLSTGRPESWTASAEMGGTPGAPNFPNGPILGARQELLSVDARWAYSDAGADLGIDWRTPGYDDSGWPQGQGLFDSGNRSLPGVRNTALSAGRDLYYFRGRFQVAGDPASQVITLQPLQDDGAVVYVNGAEIARFNMPTGTVSATTRPLTSQSKVDFGVPLVIPANILVSGTNILAVEVHATTGVTNVGLRLTPAAGYTVVWDGANGDYASPDSPALAPANAAGLAAGSQVLTTSTVTSSTNLVDGRYGTASSWTPSSTDSQPAVIIKFGQITNLSSIAWSRDNGDATDIACAGGTCSNRSLGTYTIQYTLAPDVTLALGTSTNPTNGWATIASAQYLSVQPGFAPHLRHRFELGAVGGQGIKATAVRLRMPSTVTLDELEVNTPTRRVPDAAFGAVVRSRAILAPAPKLVINEISDPNPGSFWVEVQNVGDVAVDLTGVHVRRSGAAGGTALFAPGSLAPGAFAVANFPAGVTAMSTEDRLFLYPGDESQLLDSASIKAQGRARFPDGIGEWGYPDAATPGGANQVTRRRDVVINEIMYHAPPIDPVPGVYSNATLVSMEGNWRYHDQGVDLGAGWRAFDYDASAWPEGKGLLYFNVGSLPAKTNTLLTPGRQTYYFRTRFTFNGPTAGAQLVLSAVVDDGAVFYLNGVEVNRYNLPAGDINYSTLALGPVSDATLQSQIIVPSELLRQGENVLAVEVHQSKGATQVDGLIMTGGGLVLQESRVTGNPVPPNLARQAGVVPFVIDSLSGFPIHDYLHLNDGVYGNNNSWIGNSGNPGYAGLRFGGLYTIRNIAFGRDNLGINLDRSLGLYTLQYTRVAVPGTSTAVTGNPETGWATVGTLDYQGPGVGIFNTPSRRHQFGFTPVDATGVRLVVPAVGIGGGICIDELEINTPELDPDLAFGAELSLRTTISPELVYQESKEQWIELHNRSDAPVDLTGWRLDSAVDFQFTNGPVLPAGGFVVVAKDASALRLKWPEVADKILGDFGGKLSSDDRFLVRDARGNVVDEGRVFKGGWSDAGGSSLELRNPNADRLASSSWADSDEAARAVWKRVSYRMAAGQNFGSTRWNEFRLGLLDDGQVLIDDVSVIKDPDGARIQLIQNGNFETITGNTHWRALGNHAASYVLDPDDASNHVLQISASGRAVMNHNHIESTFAGNAALVDGQSYEVSYRARWVAGSPQVSTRAYFAKLARVNLLPMPVRNGTPAARNSRWVANAGPTLTELRHSPVVPAANQPVTISVTSSDPDGVDGATLTYRVNPALTFTNLPMVASTNGIWTATIPGFAAGRVIQFYVTAQDRAGMTSLAPPKGPQSRALYQVADTQKTALPLHEIRLIMLDADRDFLFAPTNVMSNARLGGTIIYDRSEVFYDAGPRLQGTVASRIRDGDEYVSYDLGFPSDHLFRGVQENIGVDRSGRGPTVRGQDEICIHQMYHKAGILCQYSDLCYFISPRTVHTGTAILQLSAYGPGFIDEISDAGGSVFNMDLTYEPNETVNGNVEGIKTPVPLQGHLGTDITDLGDQEQYRSPFDIRSGNRRDYYGGIMRLGRTMALSGSAFESQIDKALDVEAAMRMAALEILCGVGDTYINPGSQLPHNLRMFTPFDGGPAILLPWDMDFAFSSGTEGASVFPYAGVNLGKIVSQVSRRRLYLHHVYDLCQTAFNVDYMTPWLNHYGSVVGQSGIAGNASFIAARRASALSQLPPVVPLAITSNKGQNFAVATNRILLNGTAWVDARSLEINGRAVPVTWSTLTNWEATVDLASGVNLLKVQGLDGAGNRPANLQASVTVTNLLVSEPTLPVVINEWMANNVGPGGYPSSDGTYSDWFELYNPNSVTVDLSGHFLTDTLLTPRKFLVPDNTRIAPKGYLLVWADDRSPLNGPGVAELHANFKLNNGGEELGLFAPNGTTALHTVTFGVQSANVSQGLYPDGAVGSVVFMSNWSPKAANRLGARTIPQFVGFQWREGRIELVINADSGHSYLVESAEEVQGSVWIPVTPPQVATEPRLQFSLPVEAVPRRFYRVRSL